MADLSNVQFQPQNPNALFSPDQWTNAYSQFSGKALPWPSSYTGYPTDAMGNWITPQADSGIPDYAQWKANQAAAPAAAPSTPGTTINSNPLLADLQAQVNQQTINSANATQSNNTGTFGNVNTGIANYPGAVDAIIGNAKYREQANQDYAAGKDIGMPQAQPSQQAAPAAASNSLTYPQVLALLANPGKVTTPGATVPAGPSAQPGAGVNNAFLQQAQGRPGMNQGFLSALAALQGRS
jgi:hypothetical protein